MERAKTLEAPPRFLQRGNPADVLDEVYLAELSELLRAADRAVLAGETTTQHHGPYVALTMAENLCVTRMIRREAASA